MITQSKEYVWIPPHHVKCLTLVVENACFKFAASGKKHLSANRFDLLTTHQPKMWWFVCAEELSTKICPLCNLQGWQLVTTWLWNYSWTQTQNIVAIGHMGRASAAILSQHGVMQVFYHSHSTLGTNCACSRACNQSHLIWDLIITVLPWLVQQQKYICVNYVWQ